MVDKIINKEDKTFFVLPGLFSPLIELSQELALSYIKTKN